MKAFIPDIDRHNTVGSFHSVVAWIECKWLHDRWGAVKAVIPDHIASQYRRFISFRCCLDRMQSCTSSTNLTICPHFWYLLHKALLPTKGRFAWVFGGVYTVLGETTRNPTNTMVKPLDSNRAVVVVERCMSCLVGRSISNLSVVYALARRQ